MDTQIVEKIVTEVKSQGVFDEFRKDSMADVDTKPAYQNLRQRVENSVKKFLSEQKWTPETNKNQLREKLRRHITESGFLDVGVERIVDQVVNPKIGSVFQPRIEEIAYKYLGLPAPPKKFVPPPPPLMHPLPPLPLSAPPLKVETSSLLPTDLEQVSPDSDKGTVKSEGKDDKCTMDVDFEEKPIDDDESPPFEPLVKQEQEENKEKFKEDKISIKNEGEEFLYSKTNKIECNDAVVKKETVATDNESQGTYNFTTEAAQIDNEASQSVDARISQNSQYSSVSSESRLSANSKEDFLHTSSQEAVAANISEEAQMPKFNENSCEPSASNGHVNEKVSTNTELHFDIKKDEIKFEGTERKSGLENSESAAEKSEKEMYLAAAENPTTDAKNDSFKFNTKHSSLYTKEEGCERTLNIQELSFGSSIEDSYSLPLGQTPKSSVHHKDKEDSPQLYTPKQSMRSNTPTTTPIPTPPLPTPAATPSPVALQKPDKEHQSRHSSSSSSKHKKHSKERRRSYEREKEKDSRDRHRSSKDTKESSKYHSSSSTKSSSKHCSSSSSSKYSSSHNKSSEKDIDKYSSSSKHYSSKHTKHSHSHSSSSSNENQDSKKTKRDSERRPHFSSSLSSKQRAEKKDDHGEAKHKTHRRKSTDSNDDDGDKSIGGGGKYVSQYKSNYSASFQSQKTKSSCSEKNKTTDHQKDNLEVSEIKEAHFNQSLYQNNVVILNDILENPQTQFIQLNNYGHLVETPLQGPQSSINETDIIEYNNNIEPIAYKEEKGNKREKEPQHKHEKNNIDIDLLYFEEVKLNITDRLKLINDTVDLCRSAVNSLRFDSVNEECIGLTNEKNLNSGDNNAKLLTETLKRRCGSNYAEFQQTPRKRMLSNESDGCQLKMSPSLSDSSSVNSKENEEIHKNTYHKNKSSMEPLNKTAQKLNQQQRYSSEDLYKPRPILGQRSRRRDMNPLA